jgi:hypothetical protein
VVIAGVLKREGFVFLEANKAMQIGLGSRYGLDL